MATESTTVRSSNPLTAFITSKGFVLALRLFLGALFVFSASDKVLDPEKFAIAVRGYKLLPVALSNVFALVLAWSELLAGILLILGIYTRQAAAAVLLMLVMFIGAIATTIIRGLVVDCGCFSNEGGSQTGYLLIVRNIFLITACLIVMQFDGGFFGLSRFVSRSARGA
jgi:putative oxidoreductase